MRIYTVICTRISMMLAGVVVASLGAGLGACDKPCRYPACDAAVCTSPCDNYEAAGYCIQKTARCCSDSDCGDGTCNQATGYCREGGICLCASEQDCPPTNVCVAGPGDCGYCAVSPPSCTIDAECPVGFYCKEGRFCQERCCAP